MKKRQFASLSYIRGSLAILASFILAMPSYGRTWEEIKKSGELRIATRNRQAVALIKDGTYHGFHYCLIDNFAKSRKLKLTVEIRPHSFVEYFTREGKNLDDLMAGKAEPWTPEVFDRNDVSVDGFNLMPWRAKLGEFVELSHSRQVIVYNKDRMPKPKKLGDLKGYTVYANASTTQSRLAEEIGRKVPIQLKIINAEGSTGSRANDLMPLISGKADWMIYDSNHALADIKTHRNLDFAFAAAPAEPYYWMLEKGNLSLKKELDNFIAESKSNGVFNKCFLDEYHVTSDDHIRSISILNEAPE
jgi:membrane-bound lytic murein transglycosylase MltF